MKLQIGVNPGVSNQAYHQDREYLSSSVLKTILHDIAEYKKYYIDGVPKPEPKNRNALDEGSLCHSLILEPHLTHKEFAFFEGPMKRGPAYDAFVKTAGARPIISTVQKDRVDKLVGAYKRRSAATALLADAQVEYTICAVLNGVPVKVRFDAAQVEKGIISDVKTTGYSGEITSFKQTINDLEYDLSAALYTMVAEQHFGKAFDFYFIVLSKQDFSCNVYKTSQQTLAKGRRKVLDALDKYKKCKESGIWLDVQAGAPVLPDSEYEIREV